MDKLVAKPEVRRRRRHGAEFKRQVIAACLEPDASVEAIALANDLNANHLRRWVREHRQTSQPLGPANEPAQPHQVALVPVTVTSAPPSHLPRQEIRLDIRRNGTTVQMAWPADAAQSLGATLREVLR